MGVGEGKEGIHRPVILCSRTAQKRLLRRLAFEQPELEQESNASGFIWSEKILNNVKCHLESGIKLLANYYFYDVGAVPVFSC